MFDDKIKFRKLHLFLLFFGFINCDFSWGQSRGEYVCVDRGAFAEKTPQALVLGPPKGVTWNGSAIRSLVKDQDGVITGLFDDRVTRFVFDGFSVKISQGFLDWEFDCSSTAQVSNVTNYQEPGYVNLPGRLRASSEGGGGEAIYFDSFARTIGPVLEKIARLRVDVPVKFNSCGQKNAFYRSYDGSITICRELQTDFSKFLASTRRSDPSLSQVEFGGIFFVIAHEVGHAIVDIHKVPVMAQEEAIVDAFSAYLVLLTDSPIFIDGAISVAEYFRWSEGIFHPASDVHLSGPQRKFNLMCLATGKYTKIGRMDILSDIRAKHGVLPEARSKSCVAEYEKLDSSFKDLFGKYIVIPK